MEFQFNYSVIVPHYNIPDLLMRCLKSVPVRGDIQVIVVDDCSPGADKYKEQYPELSRPYLEFYSTGTNGGGGKARNIGLQHAKGKYVLFADADDFFEKDFAEILSEYANKEFDIAFFKGSSCDTDTYEPTHRADHLNRYVDLYKKGQDNNGYNLRYLFGEPWCKIVKRTLITKNNIRFDETNIHNDTTFGYLIGYYANDIIVDDRILYYVTTRKKSVSVTVSEDRLLTRVEVYGKAELFFKEHNLPLINYRHYQQLMQLVYYRNYGLFFKSYKKLLSLGFSRIRVTKGCCIALIQIIKYKLNIKKEVIE